ncbi:MAG: AAA-like domain-containing protein [Verrucomicrobia bacterium]|nr:AAA-like domain-containing protein [Verrucomicrobiota bacterium]
MSTPSNNFFVTGGTLRHDAPSYVERRADQDLYAGLLAGEFCYVLTSRQMGKSSLMVRTVKRLRADGAAVAVLDLTAIGQNLTPEQWYDGLVARLGQQLDLEDELLNFWRANPQWGPLQRWLTALEKVILPALELRPARLANVHRELHAARDTGLESEVRLVVFIDEIDVVRSLPFSTDEFFAALRECYNRRTNEAVFNRLTFCLIGVATPSDLIRETRMTPFNIGRRIELTDFTEAEVSPLVNGLASLHRDDENAVVGGREVLQRILYWTGGHPYLTQRLCRAVVEVISEPASATAAGVDGVRKQPPARKFSAKLVDTLCAELFLSHRARERDDNLIFVRERLLNAQTDRASLLHLYERVRAGRKVADDETNALVGILHLAGIVHGRAGRLHLRNRIYSRVFDLRWVTAHMPDAELRRQREAFRRGVVRTMAAGGVLALVLAAWLLSLLRSHHLDRAIPLADGSLLTLEAVLPANQTFVFGKFRTALFDTLALPFRDEAGPKAEFRFPNPNPDPTDPISLVAWFTQKAPEADRYLSLSNFSHLEILDDHGCRMINWAGELPPGSESARPTGPQVFTEDASVILGAGELKVFPRGQKEFTLKFIDRRGELMASFTNVPNPAYERPRNLRPEMLPATHRDGDLAVTLKRVTLELDKWTTAGVELRTAKVKPEFELSQQGQPTTEWEPAENQLLDRVGNRVKIPVDQDKMPIPMLCLREPAWRLRMEFFRKPESKFPAEDSWNLGGLNIPPAGREVSFVNQTNQLHNLTFKLLAVGGGRPGGDTNAPAPIPLGFTWRGKWLDGLQTNTSARGYFHLRISGRALELRVTLRLADAQGNSWAYPIDSPREGVYQVMTELPAGTPLAAASLIVQKSRIVAFDIKPPAPLRP